MVALLKRIVFAPSKSLFLSPSFSSYTSSPPSDQSALISAVVSLLTHHRSKSRWNHLRSLLSTTTTATLTPIIFSQIALQLKSNPHLALRFFHFTLRHSFCAHNLRSYSTVIHILSRARLKTLARSVIRAALGSPELNNSPAKLFEVLVKTYRECDSAPFVFDLLIKSCLDLKKIDGSIQIVRMLKSRGISPQISTCNSLISSVSRCKGSYEGYGVFRKVFGSEDGEKIEGEAKRDVRVSPNVHSFNALMVGFYRDGDMEMVEETWSEMGSFGCVANAYSYSVLMAMLCEGGRMREVEKIWEEMKVKGIRPDLVAYNTNIGQLCKIGEIEKAEGFVREMGLCGIESSCVTFEHLIRGYCKVGNFDSALLVYKDMIRKDFRLETSTMDVLVQGLCENERVSEALEVMRNATRDVGIYLSRKSYELLITGLCENERIKEALKLQAEMVGKGFEPNSKVYSAFIGGYAKIGNKDMEAMLRKEMSEVEKKQKDD
uniref:Uncharacterized protein MANES_15G146700 n=1 Tax=Rhizophora mucronata TaxID=61149 RepID=A0A2P2J614_RHIMU